ncbi:MAG TPA: divalent-cation tolerance protein CutA [Candidatus Nitrosotenuis sp.]|nr:divalent-cation tolerance protein CutA [Candidatus Nitrosotenuis sp.]
MRRQRGDDNPFVVVLVTCANLLEAQRIADAAVEQRLAACVNILTAPVRSTYRWKEKVEQATEVLLLMKTSQANLPALQAEVKRLHSYDVPEFIALPIVSGSAAYLAWLEDSLALRKSSAKGKSK